MQHLVVLQSERFSAALETLVVAPLDAALPLYARFPGAVPVTAAEAGTRGAQVALVPHLASVLADRFEAARVGKLQAATMARIGLVLRHLFELP